MADNLSEFTTKQLRDEIERRDRIDDPLDDDRDPSNTNNMTANDWDEFYGSCYERSGMSFDEYLDNDMSMNY